MNKKNLIILGSGGHCRMIVECAERLNYKINYIIDINRKIKKYEKILNIEVREISYLEKLKKNINIFIALGDNKLRAKYFNKLQGRFSFPNLIHPSSYIAKNVKIGLSNFVAPKVIINSNSSIENNCIINTGSIIEHECKIMNNVHIGPGSILCGRVKVKNNCFLGAGSKVIPNLTLETNCIIAAGSVLNINTKPNFLYAGMPAKLKKKI